MSKWASNTAKTSRWRVEKPAITSDSRRLTSNSESPRMRSSTDLRCAVFVGTNDRVITRRLSARNRTDDRVTFN
jgi:hypothetical protein